MEINGSHVHPMLMQALDPSVPPNLIVDTQVHDIVDNSDISDDERKSILTSLIKSLQSSSNQKVLLIGDVILDRYHHGHSNNLSSIGPVPVLKITRTEENAGAAAHIAQSLASLGILVDFHTAVGNDAEGKAIIENLGDYEVDVKSIEVIDNHTTLVKTRFFGSRESLLDRPQLMLQADVEEPNDIPKLYTDNIHNKALQAVEGSSAIVISDYDKGVVNNETSIRLIEAANDQEIPIVMDPKLTGLDRSTGATVVIFERRGMELLRRRMEIISTQEAAMALVRKHNWGALLILGGSDGVTLYHSDGRVVSTSSSIENPRQQVGLHDAAASAICFALGNGHDLIASSVLASAACDCILESLDGDSILTRKALMLRIEEISWKMQISDR